jgi:hypothetical protein
LKTEVGKIVGVKVEREQYTFSPEAKSLFAEIHDNWEMNVCKKFQSDVLPEWFVSAISDLLSILHFSPFFRS